MAAMADLGVTGLVEMPPAGTLTVPANVTVEAGATSASFTVNLNSISSVA